MRRAGSTLVVAGALLCAATTVGAQQTFFGVDPMGSSGNSTSARNAFLAYLTGGVGTETFEGLAVGTSNPALTFPGAGTATLTGGGAVIDEPCCGRRPTSGARLYETASVAGGGTTFVIDFSQPVAAFGFFGTDIGDFGSHLTLRFFLAGGGTADWALPFDAGESGEGDLMFAGYINTATFTGVAFLGTDGEDVFGFDDMTIGSLDQIDPTPSVVPEPSTVLLLGTGLLGVMGVGYRRRRLQG